MRISLGNKLKEIILIFWTKFTQNGFFRSKLENVSMTIEFSIFEIVYIPNFSLKRQFWFLDQICPKKIFLVQNKKVNITLMWQVLQSVTGTAKCDSYYKVRLNNLHVAKIVEETYPLFLKWNSNNMK